MSENVENIIKGIEETNKLINENQDIKVTNEDLREISGMYAGMEHGSAKEIYGEAADQFPCTD